MFSLVVMYMVSSILEGKWPVFSKSHEHAVRNLTIRWLDQGGLIVE